MNTVRRGVTQAHFNRGPAAFIALEIGFVALMAGAFTRSWVVGCGVAIALIFCLLFKPTTILLIVAFSLFWSAAAVSIGHEIGGVPGAIGIGTFGSFVAIGIHMAGTTGIIDSAP